MKNTKLVPFAVKFVKSLSDKSLESVSGAGGVHTMHVSINPATGAVIDRG
jgi:hypothetical protein